MEARHGATPFPGPSAERNAAHLQLLIDTGLLLASERSLDVIVQASLDAGLQLSGARFGAFFYNKLSVSGEVYPLYKVSGVPASAFASFPHPRPTEIFVHTFEGRGIVRSGDITQDPRYGRNAPFAGMPPGHLPVRSYLAIPVSSRGGEVLGALLYGHPDPNIFGPESESLVATVAAQAAVAMDNARLAEGLSREIAIADAARAQQRASADRLAQIFEATTDAVFLLDRSWTFTFLNRRAVELIAQGRNLIGQNIWKAFPRAVGTAFQAHYSDVMQGAVSTEFTEFYPPLEAWFYVRAYSTPEGVAVFFQDVTSQRDAESEKRLAAARLRQALDAGELGTWTWDAATDMLDLDERAASIFGSEPHAPVPRMWLRERIVLPDDLELTPRSLRETIDRDGIYQSEYRIHAENGQQRWIAAHGLATYAEGTQRVTGMAGTIQDITARKTQEAALRQTEKLAATGRMAATIAHEINNPLEAVTNLIYLCKTDPAVPAPVQRLLETADTELARVAQIAQQTLGFYRDTTHPVDIHLTELLSGVSDLFSRKLQARRLRFTLDLADNLHIYGLIGEVRQVFSNLMVNAIDASSQGTIHVRARRRRRNGIEGVSVLVADQGSGIPANVRDRLFTPFFTTKQSIGTGLGLWVTQGIIEKAGGSIAFRSRTTPPAGTVFAVFLPAGKSPTIAFSSRKSNVLQ